ncbi:MAG: TonB-dependent receptor plug domain-containing protein [Kofleriaceae bacterium]|nr:TonB-dependent receptor plug domain-containing protein [Kofleriaceae bacterium]
MTARAELFALLALAGPAYADVAPPGNVSPTDNMMPVPVEEMDDDEPVASTTSSRLDRTQIDHRPHLRPTDLFRHLPGVAAIGHSGQADQLLLRGFDARQGAAVGVLVDGIPINASSHAYAHGYADTHFMIPDSVASIAVYEGAYAPRFTTFATAGTLDIRTLDHVPGGAVVRITSGTEVTGELLRQRLRRLRYRLVGMASPELKTGSAVLAAEVGIDDGPYVHPERFRRGVALAKLVRPLGDGVLRAHVQMYSGRWLESGLLATSELEAGRLGPYSASDPSQGGIMLRSAASVSFEARSWQALAYVVDTDLRLYQNPSLFARDPLNGDQLELADDRVTYGFETFYRRPHRILGMQGRLRVGVQARVDAASATTWHDTRRLRLVQCFAAVNPCTDTAPSSRGIAAYAEEALDVRRWLHLFGGVRLDQESWNVDDRDPETMLGKTTLGGTGARARLSPTLGVRILGRDVELQALASAGAHATDARAAVELSGYGAFVRTYDAELGARVKPGGMLEAAFAAWASQLDAHEEWRADLGLGERVPETQRFGVEARMFARPLRWLTFDASLAVSRAAYADGAPVPYAPRMIANGGAAIARGDDYAGARLRVLGARATTDPALGTGSSSVVDLVAQKRWRWLLLGLTVDNLFDTAWNEAQVAGEVRVSRRVDVTHQMLVAAGAPLTVMLTLGIAP